jgi:hypothetical protein
MGNEHLAELFRLLYPEPHVIDLPGAPAAAPGAPVVAEYLLLPHARRPRLALPAGPRALRLAAVSHLPRPRGTRARLRNSAVRVVLAASGAPLRDRVRVHAEAGADSLHNHLRQLLGEPLSFSIHVGGPLRANRKPVVELLGAGGAAVGFAKLGVNDLTRALVRAEAQALQTLGSAGLRAATVPAVRHAGGWRGHELLVQQALPVWQSPVPAAPGAISAAMVEVSRACGLSTGKVKVSGYAGQLTERLEQAAARTGVRDPGLGPALRDAGLAALASGADLALTYGAWHGDWTPWNCHPTGDTVLVWDWERFTTGVPLGLDALHCQLQAAIDGGAAPRAAAQALPEQAARLLAPFGVAPGLARFTAVLYLIDIAARYLADRLDDGTQRLSAVGDWLLPVVVAETDRARWLEEGS